MRTNHSLSLLAAAVLAAGGSAVATGIGIAGAASTGPSTAERAQMLQDKSARATPPPGEHAPASSATTQGCAADAPPNVSAAWRFNPASMAQVRSRAQVIVLADVQSVEQLPDAVISAPGEPGGEIRTPMQSVRLKVRKAYKGAAEGDTIALAKLGGTCYRVDEDPAYAPGETHLLLLERGAGAALQAVSPEGRFQVSRDGTLQPVGHSSLAQSARGKRADEIAR